jgi:hypothetical protein
MAGPSLARTQEMVGSGPVQRREMAGSGLARRREIAGSSLATTANEGVRRRSPARMGTWPGRDSGSRQGHSPQGAAPFVRQPCSTCEAAAIYLRPACSAQTTASARG